MNIVLDSCAVINFLSRGRERKLVQSTRRGARPTNKQQKTFFFFFLSNMYFLEKQLFNELRIENNEHDMARGRGTVAGG